MDAGHFDRFTQSLSAEGSRRDIARALGSVSAAGLFGSLLGSSDAGAKKKGKRRKKKGKNKKRGSCTPACQGKECGDDGCDGTCGSCDGNETCQSGACIPISTCSDGVKNGSESDVDCGGSCPGCAEGKTCASRNDCAGALCHNVFHTCQTCTPDTFDCGSDGDGSCVCDTTVQGQNVCNKQNVGHPAATCDNCAAGTNCVDVGGGSLFCFEPCGAP